MLRLRCAVLGMLMPFLIASTAVCAAEEPPSFADLGKRSAVRDMRVSPDGTMLAVSLPVDTSRNRIGVLDIDTMTVKAASQLRSSLETYSSFMWVNDRYLLLTLATTFGGFADARDTGELATLDVQTGRLTYAFGYRGEAKIGTRMDRPGGDLAAAFPIARAAKKNQVLIWVSRYDSPETSEVRTLDVTNGRTKRITVAPVRNASFLVDHLGEVRLATGGATVSEHRVHVRVGGKWQLFENAEQSDRLMYPLYFAADNQHFFARITRDGAPDAVVRINIEDRTETQVYANDIADPAWYPIPTFDRKDVAAILTEDGKPAMHWLNPNSAEAKLVQAMEPQLPEHLVYPVSSSEDGQRVLLLAMSDRNDGDYYLFDRKTLKARLLMSRREWLPIEALARKEPIQVPSRDGLTLHGYLTLPTDGSVKPPLVVVPHGGPHGVRDRWEFEPIVQALATRGFAVLQINFRGSGGYGYDFDQMGRRQWGRTMQDDVTDATRWAIDSGKVDGSKVAIYGASYGGYAALMGAAREPDLYRCAISYVGVSDLQLMYDRGDIGDTRYGASYLKSVLGTDRDELKANSPSHLADQIKAKVFLIHGGRDERVPVKHAEVMRAALRKAGNEPEWFVEADEAHGFVKDSANEQLHQRVDSFLRKCLAGE